MDNFEASIEVFIGQENLTLNSFRIQNELIASSYQAKPLPLITVAKITCAQKIL